MKKQIETEAIFSVGKLFPQDVEAEKMILGAILINSDAIYDVSDELMPEYFYKEEHKHIYTAMMSLTKIGDPIDLVTLLRELRQAKTLEFVGGPAYIASLTDRIASSANIEAHARIVKEMYLKRLLITEATGIITESYNDSDLFICVEKAESMIDHVTNVVINNKEIKLVGDLSKKVDDQIQERINNFSKGIVTAIPTGIRLLDYHLYGGWQKSDFVILGGRPGMGKTAAMIKFALSAAEKGKPVAFFQLEMSASRMYERFVCSITNIDYRNLKTGELSEQEKEDFKLAMEYLKSLPIYIDDSPKQTIQQIWTKCKRLKAKGQCELVIIDYLQLLDVESGVNKQYNRQQLVGEASRNCKLMAKDLNLPLIVGCQLNRASTGRGNKEPDLSDLREAGNLEQDADIVIFPHRPAYYKEEGFEILSQSGEFVKGNGVFIFAKYREGETGKVSFSYNKSLSKISDWSEIDGAPDEFTKSIQQRLVNRKYNIVNQNKENKVRSIPINTEFEY